MDIFVKILAGVAIAGLSSLITVYLSLARFRTEKWWEKKADAYSNLLGVIHDAKAFSKYNLDDDGTARNLTKEEDEFLRVKSKKAESEICRAMDVGSFYFSTEAIACLKVYMKELSEAGTYGNWVGSWVDYLEDDFAATDKCIKSMIEIAKNDLRI